MSYNYITAIAYSINQSELVLNQPATKNILSIAIDH